MKKWSVPRTLSAINSNLKGDADNLVFLIINARLELDGGLLASELIEGEIPDGMTEDDFEPVGYYVFGDIHENRAAACFLLHAPDDLPIIHAEIEMLAYGAVDALPDPGIAADMRWINVADKAGQWTYAGVIVSVGPEDGRLVHFVRSPAIDRDKAVALLKKELADLRKKVEGHPREPAKGN